jgi:hypothetical protein
MQPLHPTAAALPVILVPPSPAAAAGELWRFGDGGSAMTPFPASVTDAELIEFMDRWASLLEQGDYDAAFAFTDHIPACGMTAALIREIVNWSRYPFDPNRRVTLDCGRTFKTERKVVRRWPEPTDDGFFGEIWYSLNIDGEASDLVATFLLKSSLDGVSVHLQYIEVT